jgi:hypothetical protein
MGGHTFPEIPCKICAKPVDLTGDLYADENGKPVHEDCYVKHVTSSRRDFPATRWQINFKLPLYFYPIPPVISTMVIFELPAIRASPLPRPVRS